MCDISKFYYFQILLFQGYSIFGFPIFGEIDDPNRLSVPLVVKVLHGMGPCMHWHAPRGAWRRVRVFNTTRNQTPNFVPGTPGIGTSAYTDTSSTGIPLNRLPIPKFLDIVF